MSACEALKAATAFVRTATSRVCPWCAQTVMVVAALLPVPAEAPTATVRTRTGTTAMTAHATFLLRIMCPPFAPAEGGRAAASADASTPAIRSSTRRFCQPRVARISGDTRCALTQSAKSNQHGAIIAPQVAMSSDSWTEQMASRASSKRVTLADVARSAGVSQTAASFVLSGRREEMRISLEVEARVLQAVRETGYRPNIVSRSLRTGATQTIGFVSDTVATTPFAGHLVWGALDAARERGHLLFIGETEGDPDLEQQLIEAMHDRRVDGIVLASMYTRKIAVPKVLLDSPAVLLNALPSRRSPIPSVLPDEREAGR